MGKAWKDLERTSAKILGGERVIRKHYGERNSDVDIADFPAFKVDSKRYKKFATFTLYEETKKKYCKKPGDQPILILRQHNKQTKLAVIDLELLAKLLNFVREHKGQDQI